MIRPFSLTFDSGPTAMAVRVDRRDQLSAAVAAIGLRPPQRVVVLVGGAGGLDAVEADRLRPLFESGLVPVVETLAAVAVDGGTRAGVMHLLGAARLASGATFPLAGVAAVGTVALPGDAPRRPDAAPLDPEHTHFLLVPGDTWGAEAPWIAHVATTLADGAPSVTVVINGGDIVYSDVARSVKAGRPVLTVAGSGRTADELAAAVRGDPADDRAVALARSHLVRAVPAGDPDGLGGALRAALMDTLAP